MKKISLIVFPAPVKRVSGLIVLVEVICHMDPFEKALWKIWELHPSGHTGILLMLPDWVRSGLMTGLFRSEGSRSESVLL